MNTYSSANLSFALTILLLVMVVWQFYKIWRLEKIRKHFYSQGMKKNLEDLMTEHDLEIAKLNQNMVDLNNQTEDIRLNNQNNLQKVGFVKFSQFSEAGNLSFALVILNDHDSGFAVSSLYSREKTNIYFKEVTNGKSKAKLTEEEQQALKIAVNSEQNGSK
jgi:hypothetical protein